MAMTVEQIRVAYQEGYAEVYGLLAKAEVARAKFLTGIGKMSLTLIRERMGRLSQLELAKRKAERANVISQIENVLPEDYEGIGQPQLNRWINWAGIEELLEMPIEGLKQTHLMSLERLVKQRLHMGEFAWNETFRHVADEIKAIVEGTIDHDLPASEMIEAIGDEVKPVSPVVERKPESEPEVKKEETQCPTDTSLNKNAPKSVIAGSPPTNNSQTMPKGLPNTPQPSGVRGKMENRTKPTLSAMSSPASAQAKFPTTNTSPPKIKSGPIKPPSLDALEQASHDCWRALQNQQVLAGVFRRECPPYLGENIVDNMIRAFNETDATNLVCLARMFKRLKPFIEAQVEAGLLQFKEEPAEMVA